MGKITAVIFDFGGVLMDWNPHYLYKKFFGDNPQKTLEFLREVGFDEWNRQLDKGRTFAEGVADLRQRFPAYQELIQAYDQRWEETLAGSIQPSVDILRELKEEAKMRTGATEFSLYALTNWSAEKFATIRHQYEFFDWFEDIVVSGEEKLIKPDPRIFQVLLQRSRRTAAECLFIDDSSTNIAAAKELGFDTILFQSPDQLRMELCKRGLLS